MIFQTSALWLHVADYIIGVNTPHVLSNQIVLTVLYIYE